MSRPIEWCGAAGAAPKAEVTEMCLHEYHWIRGSSPFVGCVDLDNCNPAAHGGVEVRIRCPKCTDTRLVNINGIEVEGIPEGYSVLACDGTPFDSKDGKLGEVE